MTARIETRAASISLRLLLAAATLCWPLLGQDRTEELTLTDKTQNGSPLEIEGRAQFHEVIKGQQLGWSWGENVVARNISDKPITLVIATLRHIGGYRAGLGDGPTYTIVEDRLFTESEIRPLESVVLRDTRPDTLAVGCCLDSINNSLRPEVEFKVLFIQYSDGSTFGDATAAEEVFAKRKTIMEALWTLVKSLGNGGGEGVGAKLEEACPMLGNLCPQLTRVLQNQGADRAIVEARRFLAIAERRKGLLPHSAS